MIWVVDTATDAVVSMINLAPSLSRQGAGELFPRRRCLAKAGHCGHFSPDPTPDLMVLSPEGTHMFLSFRGPSPLSGDPHVSTGATPGVGVLKIAGGQAGPGNLRSHRSDEQQGRGRRRTGRCSRHLGAEREIAAPGSIACRARRVALSDMVPAGYMAKRVVARPDWLPAERVSTIYSVSGCVSNNFADYINLWQHNGYWLFN